ncbi:MAG: hypothetical protein IJ502_08140, partial [Alistipes sp.]|nr:hypothetical protein [Alistipes sp.]
GVSGDYNQWGADGRDKKFAEDKEGWYIIKEFEVKENEQVIIRMNDSDMSTWGMDAAGQTAEVDKVYTLKAGGEKFSLAAGKYDLHFNPETLEFKATVSGAYYGLCGNHNNWGVLNGGTPDPQFVEAEGKAGWLVLKSLEVTAGQEAKIRMNDDWAKNWGLAGAEIAVGEQYTLEFNVANFKWAESGVFDLYFNPATLEFYIEAGKEKVYSLYGAFNGSVDWIDFDFTKHERGYYKALNMATTEEFKFLIRADHEWNEKYGASAAVELNTAATLELGGGDIALSAAAGNYDFYFNPATATLYVVAAGSADPTVPVEPVEVLYGLVGQHNGWGPDQPEGTPDPQFVEAVNKEGWLVLKNFEATADNEAKVRTKDAWAQDWGLAGASIAVGEHYTLVAYDGNFKWATTGIYDVYFNPTTLEFYIEEAAGDVYTLVGSINSWNLNDETYMFQVNGEGKLELKGVTFATESVFKVVENHSWDNADYGGTLVDGVVNLELDQMDNNISIAAGVYDMLLDLDALKLYVTKVADVEQGEDAYYLAGTHNNWTAGDTNYQFAEGASGLLELKNITFGSNGAFKVIKNALWCGGSLSNGEVALIVNGGDDISIAAGTYDFYLDPTTMKLTIVAAGSAGPETSQAIYGLVGQHNGWGGSGDDAAFTEYEQGYYKATQALVANDPFKIRSYNDSTWNNSYNYGVSGAQDSNNAVAVGAQFDLINGADARNMYVEASGTYDIYFNPTTLKCLIVTTGTTPNI